MNGEPLQIISVDGNSATEQQTIQVDAEGRHFINATAHDGQPLEVFRVYGFKKIFKHFLKLVVQSEPGHVYDEDVRQGRLVKINPTWQLGKVQFFFYSKILKLTINSRPNPSASKRIKAISTPSRAL